MDSFVIFSLNSLQIYSIYVDYAIISTQKTIVLLKLNNIPILEISLLVNLFHRYEIFN